MSVRLSAWNNSAPTEQIFIKFGIRIFFENLLRKVKMSLKLDKNNEYCTLRRSYIYGNISRISA